MKVRRVRCVRDTLTNYRKQFFNIYFFIRLYAYDSIVVLVKAYTMGIDLLMFHG